MTIDALPPPSRLSPDEATCPTKELHEILDNAALMIETWSNQFKLRSMWQYERTLTEYSQMLRSAAIVNRPPEPEPEPEPKRNDAVDAMEARLARHDEAMDSHRKQIDHLVNHVGDLLRAGRSMRERISVLEKPHKPSRAKKPKRKR